VLLRNLQAGPRAHQDLSDGLSRNGGEAQNCVTDGLSIVAFGVSDLGCGLALLRTRGPIEWWTLDGTNFRQKLERKSHQTVP
jgi:hypothetical protein